jgi:Flp pilus assembly protein TadG
MTGTCASANRKGSILVSLAIMLTALMAFVALGIEVGTWYLLRAELSKAVDAAALAGAANIASPNLNLAALAQDFGNENFAAGYLGTPATGAGAVTYTTSSTTSRMTVTGSASVSGLITKMFGVTTVPVAATGAAQKNQVEIMVVLDCSGSMAGAPITALKTAATDFLTFFTPNQGEDMMGVVTFSTAASVRVPLETNFGTAIQNVINGLSAGGATNAEDAIAQAGAQLPVQTGTPNASWKQQYIVFFTDGEPTAFRSTFVHANTSYDAVVYTTTDPYDSTNQWYDVGAYLASPTTGSGLSQNAVQTGRGQNESTCVVNQGSSRHPSYVYSTSWATPFAAIAPPAPYTTQGYCDMNVGTPRTVLAGYVHSAGEQMALNNAASLKARGVMIYTIGLEGDGGVDATFLSNLSSGPSFAYVAPTSSELEAIFSLIAKDITLRLVQ